MILNRRIWLDAEDSSHCKIYLPPSISPRLIVDNPISDRLGNPPEILLGKMVTFFHGIIVTRINFRYEDSVGHA